MSNDLEGVRDFMQLVYEEAKSKGWWNQPRNKGEMIALMHSELSEALEALRKPDVLDSHLPHLPAVGVEMADTIIRIFDFCAGFDIDLATCIEEKFRYNKTRPHKHGGKKF
ncbi:MAG: hypothetical protein V3W44_10030 [Dehalococcoidales bacterium]